MTPGGGLGWGARHLGVVLAQLILVLLGSSDALGGPCSSPQGLPERVLARLPLYDAERGGTDGAIQSFTEGDPGLEPA